MVTPLVYSLEMKTTMMLRHHCHLFDKQHASHYLQNTQLNACVGTQHSDLGDFQKMTSQQASSKH